VKIYNKRDIKHDAGDNLVYLFLTQGKR